MKHYSLKQPDNVEWWFYYGGEPISSVIFPRQASAEQVRAHAIRLHRAVPLHFPPYEHEAHLCGSRVCIFDPHQKFLR